MSAPDSVPHAASVLACLVVESKQLVSFPINSNFNSDCCLVCMCIENETRNLKSFIVVPLDEFLLGEDMKPTASLACDETLPEQQQQ